MAAASLKKVVTEPCPDIGLKLLHGPWSSLLYFGFPDVSNVFNHSKDWIVGRPVQHLLFYRKLCCCNGYGMWLSIVFLKYTSTFLKKTYSG